MHLPSTTHGSVSLPNHRPARAAQLAPPQSWSRWWTSPIARVNYGPTAQLQAWHESFIPTERSLTGSRSVSMTYGGATRDEAITAARLLAQSVVQVTVDVGIEGARSVQINPAIAVLRDARNGAFWLASLTTTMRHGDEWVDAPHSIDGAAFEGPTPLLHTASVLTATPNMVAVVGRDTVLTPSTWTDAPHDSRGARR